MRRDKEERNTRTRRYENPIRRDDTAQYAFILVRPEINNVNCTVKYRESYVQFSDDVVSTAQHPTQSPTTHFL